MRTILIAAAAIVALALAAVGAGALLPRTTEVTRSVTLPVDVARAFRTVTDAAGQTRWRSDIGAVEMAADGRNWVEHTKAGDRIAFAVTDSVANERFAITYVSQRGFTGEWTGLFARDGEGTRLEVTERVTLPNPLLRLIGRVLAPPGSHTDLYLADLRNALRP